MLGEALRKQGFHHRKSSVGHSVEKNTMDSGLNLSIFVFFE